MLSGTCTCNRVVQTLHTSMYIFNVYAAAELCVNFEFLPNAMRLLEASTSSTCATQHAKCVKKCTLSQSPYLVLLVYRFCSLSRCVCLISTWHDIEEKKRPVIAWKYMLVMAMEWQAIVLLESVVQVMPDSVLHQLVYTHPVVLSQNSETLSGRSGVPGGVKFRVHPKNHTECLKKHTVVVTVYPLSYSSRLYYRVVHIIHGVMDTNF